MTNRTKIIIGVLIITAIVVVVVGIVSNRKQDNNTNNKQDELSEIFEYIDNDVNNEETEQVNDIVENNIIEGNMVSEEQTTTNENLNSNKDAVIGKEEQESNSENTEIEDKKKAVELAKKEWAISVDSYDFQVSEVKSDGTYDVSVINKTDRNVITIYNVNVKTGTVTE